MKNWFEISEQSIMMVFEYTDKENIATK